MLLNNETEAERIGIGWIQEFEDIYSGCPKCIVHRIRNKTSQEMITTAIQSTKKSHRKKSKKPFIFPISIIPTISLSIIPLNCRICRVSSRSHPLLKKAPVKYLNVFVLQLPNGVIAPSYFLQRLLLRLLTISFPRSINL